MKGLQLLAFLATVARAFAVVPEWGQCGGLNYNGETSCIIGLTCTVVNDRYHQCQKAVSSAVSVSTAVPSTTASASATGAHPAATGFVETSGTEFTLNGAKYPVVGANSYWVGLSGYNLSIMNTALADISAAGSTVVRTWGFNDVTSPNGIYYQSWSGGKPSVNTGSTGLQNFDNLVEAAKANGLRLIVALTNNWADYGGMDVYVNQIAGSGSAHDLFYTNNAIITSFKDYIKAFISRYADEPTILAWELANEPRCKGSTGTTTGNCTPATITKWAADISAYIKSLDSNHLVAIGDEGFYNQPGAPTYPYQGGEGIDFDANLAIDTIDFGTFHSYPIGWGQSGDPQGWGTKWITDHATSMKTVAKPVILEEFGVTDNKQTVYSAWYSEIISSGLTGDLIWQAGSHLPTGTTHDDGFTIYPDDPVYELVKDHAAALKSRE